MNKDLFEYEMKSAGYRTPESRAEALGVTMSAYYRRTSGECECSKEQICRIADILGQEKAWRIFFAN
jgi:hypothetical protein